MKIQIYNQQVNPRRVKRSNDFGTFKSEFSSVKDDSPLKILGGLSKKVFLDRYALRAKNGDIIESTPEEMWRRVAWGISQAEKPKDRVLWEQRFYEILKDFKFIPGGRILSGAGTGYEVTYFNCFVIPSPKDSRHGILDSLGQLVEIQARSGGVGLNLSSLRPRGARVKKVNGFSSGPVTWAGLFSYATYDVVQQGGSRRGATMIMLWDWHPDIEEFITVKQDLTKIHGANLSVCISDAFMQAVKEDKDWNLVYPDLDDPQYDEFWDGELDRWLSLGKKIKIYKVVKARYLWDLICQASWRSAEPGLHFLERSNKWSNSWYFERLVSTNPCLTVDTWIHTSKGPKQIYDLINVPFLARINGRDYQSSGEGFFKTGNKQVFSLETKEGYALRLTTDHLVKRVTKLTRYSIESEWIEAGKLQQEDRIILHDHRLNPTWDGSFNFEEGYLMGLLIGDGTLKKDGAVLSVWNSGSIGAEAVMSEVSGAVQSFFSPRADFAGWMAIAQRGEYRLSTAHIKKLATELGMSAGNKTITPIMEKTSSNFYQGLIRGLFDTDGSVQGSQQKGVSVRLAQSNLDLLKTTQRMLLRLGIASTIYQNRRLAHMRLLPNGKGGMKQYKVKAQHELVISGENLLFFNEVIGFKDSSKVARLRGLLKKYKRALNRERFVATVESITPSEVEEVYDVQIPFINAFDANGLYVHNCGEQCLGPWAVCNLGSMNLSAYVKDCEFDYDNFGRDVKVAMRFMDDVIDETYYFFPENEKCAKAIRRTGLGITGLADALIKMRIRYGSADSEPVTHKIFKTLRDNAYEASSDIAKEKGFFPKFDKEKYLQGYYIQNLPDSIRKKIAEQGIRNAVLLTIAPTGTISVIAGASSGIEPVYEFSYLQRWRGGEDMVYHPLYEAWMKENPGAPKPDYFVSANDLTPLEHVKVQAIAQQYIDSSISKTVNAPNTHSVDDVKNLYMAAYDMGLKGITYMREGSRPGPLERVDESKKQDQVQPVIQTQPVHRPAVLNGRTYKMLTPVGEAFITINRDEKGAPMEVFATIGKAGMQTSADAEAIGRLISLSLRMVNGNRVEIAKKVVSQLRGIGGSSQVGFGKNRVMSLGDAIAQVLAEEISKAASSDAQALLLEAEHDAVVAKQLNMLDSAQDEVVARGGDLCPECGHSTFVLEEGCQKCYSCGYSKC